MSPKHPTGYGLFDLTRRIPAAPAPPPASPSIPLVARSAAAQALAPSARRLSARLFAPHTLVARRLIVAAAPKPDAASGRPKNNARATAVHSS